MADMVLDLADPEVLTLVARAIPFPAGILHRWLPTKTRRDHRYRFFKKDRTMRRATPLRPWDTPAVPIERGQLEEVTGRMLPLSNIMWLLEEESQLLDAAIGTNDEEAILSVFNSDVLALTRSALQRVMLLQGEAVSTGKIQIGSAASPENGLQMAPIDFAVAADHIFTAATLWNAGGVDILGQLGTYKQTFRTGTGGEVDAGVAIMSTRVLNIVLVDTAIRTALGSVLGTPPSVGLNQVQQVLTDRQLPRIIVDDTAVPDHNGVMRRQIPDDRVILLPEDPTNPNTPTGMPIGQTQWGLTEEAKKLARAQAISDANGPGLVSVPMESENPVRTGTLVTGIAMPVITEPDLVMSIKVL